MFRHMEDSVASRAPGLPAAAACRLVDVHDGFEVLFARGADDGHCLDGHSTGVEEGVAWGIRYEMSLDSRWITRSARVFGRSEAGTHEVVLEGDGSGGWTLDGEPAPELAGCFDVDVEASGFTNLIPVRRLGLEVGERADAPAAYVRVPDLRVERLEQSYERLPDEDGRSRYDYRSPADDFAAVITYDADGVVRDYPGIAVRLL
jgi:uncharacterized protein